jgi:hypothetical protein
MTRASSIEFHGLLDVDAYRRRASTRSAVPVVGRPDDGVDLVVEELVVAAERGPQGASSASRTVEDV